MQNLLHSRRAIHIRCFIHILADAGDCRHIDNRIVSKYLPRICDRDDPPEIWSFLEKQNRLIG